MTAPNTATQTETPQAPIGPTAPGNSAPPSSTTNAGIYGSFWIDSTEFAVPVEAIREVVNKPESISPVPLAPPFMMGLFNLRGMIIPIVDLRVLLEIPEGSESSGHEDGRKVAIIENSDKCIGILFDRAGEVLNEPNSARVGFNGVTNGVKDVVIDGVLKLDNGNRMVQIIDPYEMLRIERVPKAEASELNIAQRGHLGKRLSCVSFQLGHTFCAIDLRYVQEVRDMPNVDESLLSHGCVIGTVNLRGVIIPVVDFRSFMGDEPPYKMRKDALGKRKLLVMKSDGGLIGLMVYSIDSIIPFFEGEVMPFAKLALPKGEIVRGCLMGEDHQLVMLLNQKQLMSDPMLVDAARNCHEVYNTSDPTKKETVAAQASERKTFILFSIANRFAMDTLHVSEVIDKPTELLEPPYALDYVEGIINLRGELITLINLRRLYGLDPCGTDTEKAVIFKSDKGKYAILVDSVDEIVMTTADKVSENNRGTDGEAVRAASKDVSGVLHVSSEGEVDAMVLIMDVQALIARCTDISG